MSMNRRDFLKTGLSGLAYFTTAATVPAWVAKSAQAITAGNDRTLVIIQQAGGNDGLNTVIPYTDPVYTGQQLLDGQEVRPNLKILEPDLQLTMLNDGLNAFHPKLIRLRDWYMNGNVAVVQNVGYPNPNLSHFTSSKYWEFGASPDSSTGLLQGWAARFFDNNCAGADPAAVDAMTLLRAGDSSIPDPFKGTTGYVPPAVQRFEKYELEVPRDALGDHQDRYIRVMNSLPTIDSAVDYMQRASNSAIASVDDIQFARTLDDLNQYPDTDLGRGLEIASKVIRAGFQTKIFFVHQSGYDTHANQYESDPAKNGGHADLLDEFDQSVNAFLSDMESSGNSDRVLVMTFSEFGRRIHENGSKGSDHGVGNNLFLMGGRVNGGVYCGQPDLQDLVKGKNLRHKIDFRAVHSMVIQDWLLMDPVPVFGSQDFFNPMFDIPGGIAALPVINNGATKDYDPAKISYSEPIDLPAAGGWAKATAFAATAAAGAWAINRRMAVGR